MPDTDTASSETASRLQANDASELALLHRFRQMPARRRKALLLLLKPDKEDAKLSGQ